VETVKTFATLRFAGDALVPDQITRALRVVPTLGYAKGEMYQAGPRSPEMIGKTGVWYFSTDRLVASDRLSDHVAFVALLLSRDPVNPLNDPARFLTLQKLMRRQGLQAAVTCFWHGPPGAKKPTLPRPLVELFKTLPADVETDFEVDEEPSGSHLALT
jgi:hypothetical protein